MNNGLSLLKVVNGLSKTLNIANQMIPLYKQVKPLISNSGKVIFNLKSFSTNNNSNNSNDTQKSISPPDYAQETIVPNNSPTFFL